MENRKFIDLHVHDCYSVLDGMIKIEDYIKFAQDNNLKAISTSNHGNIDNFIDFYCKCKDAKIKCILGSEFYMSNGILDENDEETKNNFHLNLYAKNHVGYKNLIKLKIYCNTK